MSEYRKCQECKSPGECKSEDVKVRAAAKHDCMRADFAKYGLNTLADCYNEKEIAALKAKGMWDDEKWASKHGKIALTSGKGDAQYRTVKIV